MTEVIFLGCGSAGKTLVSRQLMYRIRLQAHHGPAEAKSSGSDTSVASGSFINATTTPTTGMQFESIQFQGHGVVLREVGYDMARLWHKYYKKADVLLFVVDAANRAQLAQASVELYRILEHPSAKSKPLILLFNKIDQSLCMDIETVRQFIHVAELRKVHKGPVYDCPVSALKGWNFDVVLEVLLKCVSQ